MRQEKNVKEDLKWIAKRPTTLPFLLKVMLSIGFVSTLKHLMIKELIRIVVLTSL